MQTTQQVRKFDLHERKDSRRSKRAKQRTLALKRARQYKNANQNTKR